MSQVAVVIVVEHLDVYGRAGVDTARCFEGLPWTEAELRGRSGRVDWDPYATLISRMSAALPDDDAVSRVGATMDTTASWINMVVASFVSPLQLFRFWTLLVPRAWRGLTMEVREVPGGRLYVRCAIPAHYQGCRAFFVATIGSWVTTTRRIGLPSCTLVSADVGTHHGVYVLEPPPSHTVAHRITQVDLSGLFALLDVDQPPRSSPPTHEAAMDRAITRWGLTPAQGRVLARVVVGRTNKEVAADLGISEATIEAHLTQCFRKSGTESRTALTAAYWSGS